MSTLLCDEDAFSLASSCEGSGIKDVTWLNAAGQKMTDEDWQNGNTHCFWDVGSMGTPGGLLAGNRFRRHRDGVDRVQRASRCRALHFAAGGDGVGVGRSIPISMWIVTRSALMLASRMR